MAPYSVAINLARHQRRRGHSARPWGIRFLREWAAFCCSAIACSRPARHGAAPLLCAALALLLRQDSVLLRILGGAPVASMQLGAWWRQDERRKQRTALLWARCRGGLRCPAARRRSRRARGCDYDGSRGPCASSCRSLKSQSGLKANVHFNRGA